jgi:hypothetical protein
MPHRRTVDIVDIMDAMDGDGGFAANVAGMLHLCCGFCCMLKGWPSTMLRVLRVLRAQCAYAQV